MSSKAFLSARGARRFSNVPNNALGFLHAFADGPVAPNTVLRRQKLYSPFVGRELYSNFVFCLREFSPKFDTHSMTVFYTRP